MARSSDIIAQATSERLRVRENAAQQEVANFDRLSRSLGRLGINVARGIEKRKEESEKREVAEVEEAYAALASTGQSDAFLEIDLAPKSTGARRRLAELKLAAKTGIEQAEDRDFQRETREAFRLDRKRKGVVESQQDADRAFELEQRPKIVARGEKQDELLDFSLSAAKRKAAGADAAEALATRAAEARVAGDEILNAMRQESLATGELGKLVGANAAQALEAVEGAREELPDGTRESREEAFQRLLGTKAFDFQSGDLPKGERDSLRVKVRDSLRAKDLQDAARDARTKADRQMQEFRALRNQVTRLAPEATTKAVLVDQTLRAQMTSPEMRAELGLPEKLETANDGRVYLEAAEARVLEMVTNDPNVAPQDRETLARLTMEAVSKNLTKVAKPPKLVMPSFSDHARAAKQARDEVMGDSIFGSGPPTPQQLEQIEQRTNEILQETTESLQGVRNATRTQSSAADQNSVERGVQAGSLDFGSISREIERAARELDLE